VNQLFNTLPNTITTGPDPSRYDLLRNSLQHTPGIEALVLLSNDGLPIAAYGVEEAEAQRITAMCSGMASITAQMSGAVDGAGVLHTLITMERRTVVMSACGPDSALACVLDSRAHVGLAMREIVDKARAFADHLGALPRFQAASR
jgi:predicted regulator of Ras-like GTPase activity (Roadblock/LC7/MglB family)